MKRKEKYLIALAVVYAVLFILKKTGVHFMLISDHASDLICIPLSLLFIEWFSGKLTNKRLEIGIFQVLAAILYFTLVFEIWMPRISSNQTADILDVICYLVGGMIYLFCFKKHSASTQTV